MNLNKVILAGNLTRSPELRYIPGTGSAVANFGIATNMAWTDEQGEQRQETEFHNIVAFGRQAETAAEYLRKGQLVLIEGRLRTRSWEQDGIKRFRTEIVAQRLQFGPRRQEESGQQDEEPEGERSAEAPETPEETIDDEIPF